MKLFSTMNRIAPTNGVKIRRKRWIVSLSLICLSVLVGAWLLLYQPPPFCSYKFLDGHEMIEYGLMRTMSAVRAPNGAQGYAYAVYSWREPAASTYERVAKELEVDGFRRGAVGPTRYESFAAQWEHPDFREIKLLAAKFDARYPISSRKKQAIYSPDPNYTYVFVTGPVSPLWVAQVRAIWVDLKDSFLNGD